MTGNKKFSEFPDADNSGPITGVGLQGGANVKFPGPGFMLLGSDSITNSAGVELTIPAGYYAFKILVGDIVIYFPAADYPTLTSPDQFALQVSFNGTDWEDGGSDYQMVNTQAGGSGQANTHALTDSMFLCSHAPCGDLAGYGSASEIIFYPGTTALRPYFKADTILAQNQTGLQIYWEQISGYYIGAHGAGRVAKVRIGPYFGDGASADFTYSLWGIPDLS